MGPANTPWQPWCVFNHSASVNVDAFFVYTSAGDQEMHGRDVGGQGMLEIGVTVGPSGSKRLA